jgi:drug/metabolite transporter (DMT)-like permease
VFCYALAYLVLGETLTAQQLLGGGLILAGVLFVTVRSGPRRERFRWGSRCRCSPAALSFHSPP